MPEHTAIPEEEKAPAPSESATKYGESPMLTELVEAGELPPVDERLPTEPMVIDLPWAEYPGRYGGTMRKVTTSSSFVDQTELMYGFSPLHWIDGGMGVGPGMAKSWERNEDATEWTFYFRRGLKWSDGQPFTVDDIIFWWEDMVLNEEHPATMPSEWAVAGGEPMAVEKVDDYTIRLKFAGPSPLVDIQIAAWANGGVGTSLDMQPKHYMEQFHPDYSDYEDFEMFFEKEEWWTNPEHPVMTGWMPVELEPGNRLVMERNPYCYYVDREGNQLPYIDRVDVKLVEDIEVAILKILDGEVDFQAHPSIDWRDLPVLRENEDSGEYRTLLWDNGAGGAPSYCLNLTHPESEKREVYNKIEFRRALSHAIDRPKIHKMIFFGLGGPLSTGVDSINSWQYHYNDQAEEMLDKLLNLAVEYDIEKANQLLDEAGVIDQNGDGWRDMPSGEELKLFLQMTPGSPYMDVAETVKNGWQEVGLNAVIDTMSGQELGVITNDATFDIRERGGGAPGSADLMIFSVFFANYGLGGRWAPLYGSWMALKGTPQEGVDADKSPHERTPPWEEPPEDHPAYKIWELFEQAKTEPDRDKRWQIVYDMMKVHLEEGPFWLGVVADLPRIVVAKNGLKNVPNHEEIPLGGWLGPWVVAQPGAITYPEQYYFEG
jgi:peptide/nickel transport system substrate-binding protein